jgi:nitroreductase
MSGNVYTTKKAPTDHPVHEFIAGRWSAYGYSNRAVPEADLRSLFEAARWAPSSFNEQPWSYIVARREDTEEFERMLSCLVESNQRWAKEAPVLALGAARMRFARNDKPNPHAFHDLGLATANLCVEATARGLVVHQMAGILPDRAREIYGVPENCEVATGIAIGYSVGPDDGANPFEERDSKPRSRKPLKSFVFGGRWDEVSNVLAD